MTKTLDYATPIRRSKPLVSKLTCAAGVSAIEHAFIFFCFAATLDGGTLGRRCAVVSVAFWAVVLMIVFRRRFRREIEPTTVDLWIVAAGYPVMLCICLLAMSFSS